MTEGRPWYHQHKHRSIFPEAAPLALQHPSKHDEHRPCQMPPGGRLTAGAVIAKVQAAGYGDT